ncbi:hypothetical protein ACP70R_038789 [Stipagrostis hirtigluma subsp. patula]
MAAASEDGEQQVYWRSSLLPHGCNNFVTARIGSNIFPA